MKKGRIVQFRISCAEQFVKTSEGKDDMSINGLCRVEIGLLGPFSLRVDDREVESEAWKSKKALTLLKYLASRHGQKASSDALIELLWPDQLDVYSQRNLHTAVWFARRILPAPNGAKGESPLRYSHGSYWLELEESCVDTILFESHARKSRQLETSNPEMALFHCEAALKVYRDDFLSDEVYEDWTIPYREEYREVYFQVVVRAAELLIRQRGDFNEAVQLCRTALKRDPYREELYHAALKALISGRRFVEAVNLYKQYVQMLQDEFGLEPSPAIVDLISKMKEGLDEASPVPKAPGGAYVCSRTVLRSFFETEQRRLQRTGNHFSALVIGNSEAGEQKFLQVFAVLQSLLRHSDVICHYAPTMIVVFLPATGAFGARIVFAKIQETLEQKFGSTAPFSFLILSSEELDVLQKEWSAIANT